MSKKTGSQPQSERPTPTELELDLTQTSGQTCCGPAPHQSGQCSLPGLGASVRPPTLHHAHALLPGTSQPLYRFSNQCWLPSQQGEGLHKDRMGCNREEADCVWTLRFSLQYFRHNCLLLALGFHGFLHVLDCKLPRTKDRATSFSCLLTQPPLCQAWAQKRRCQSSAGESPAHLFCILSPAEARATRQHREGPGRKQQSLYTKPTCGYKKEPSLLPPGWARFLGGDELGRELVLAPGHTATAAP